jgi:hypothetical protein
MPITAFVAEDVLDRNPAPLEEIVILIQEDRRMQRIVIGIVAEAKSMFR